MSAKENHFLTTADVMSITGLGKSTVTRLIREGQLPATVVPSTAGRPKYLVRDEDLLEAMQDGALPSPRHIRRPEPQKRMPAERPQVRHEPAITDSADGGRVAWAAIAISASALVVALVAVYLAVQS